MDNLEKFEIKFNLTQVQASGLVEITEELKQKKSLKEVKYSIGILDNSHEGQAEKDTAVDLQKLVEATVNEKLASFE